MLFMSSLTFLSEDLEFVCYVPHGFLHPDKEVFVHVIQERVYQPFDALMVIVV